MHLRRQRALGAGGRFRRTVLPILVAVTAAAAGVGVSVQPAAAHNNSNPLYWRATYNDGRQCTVVRAAQNHGPPVSSNSTMSTTYSYWGGSDCYNFYPHNQHPYRIWQKGTLYRNGIRCIEGGWQPNVVNHYLVEWASTDNLQNICGQGRTVISHDLEQQVWNPYANRWNTSAATPFPTTFHNYTFCPCT